MVKKIFLSLFVVTILTMVFIWIYLNRKTLVPDITGSFSGLKLYTGTQTESMPVVSWGDITSGKIASFLDYQYTKKVIPQYPTNVKVMDAYRSPNPYFIANYNFGYIELYSVETVLSKYIRPETRPYRFVGFFRTSIGSEEYVVSYLQWLSIENSVSYVPLISSLKNFQSLAEMDNNVFDEKNTHMFPSPVVTIKNEETCLKISGSGSGYCDWYILNKNKYDTLLGDWLVNKKVPINTGEFPFLLIQTPLFIDKQQL